MVFKHVMNVITVMPGVQLITELASQVDDVIPKVVEAARAVKRAPGVAGARERLDAARREWAEKVQQLTAATDDIIDPEDFIAVSGSQHPPPPPPPPLVTCTHTSTVLADAASLYRG